ncbi:MAG: hypothetical protein AABZ84_03945, partial [Pseudomonadota bacterium]
MFNPYAIILGLFALAGLAIAVWGWTLIAKGRRTRRWPAVEGIIEHAAPADANVPAIYFSYAVHGRLYR